MSIRVGIMGYGNLGRGIECALKQNNDMELVAVFSRRNPDTVKILTEGVKVYKAEEAVSHKDEIDVLILCGGSATDLPVQTPEFLSLDATRRLLSRAFLGVHKSLLSAGRQARGL